MNNQKYSNKIIHIYFLKIDAEGFEINVLAGAKELLENNAIHFIQFEFGLPNIDARIFFQDFWNMLNDKFHIYRIVADGLYVIKNYSTQLEIFATSNFIAERK